MLKYNVSIPQNMKQMENNYDACVDCYVPYVAAAGLESYLHEETLKALCNSKS